MHWQCCVQCTVHLNCLPLPPGCPLCRYSKLSDKELLHRLLQVCQAEGVAHTPDGLEAVVFTADGDMRQALNNVQVGWVGWGVGCRAGGRVRLFWRMGEERVGHVCGCHLCCLWLCWLAGWHQRCLASQFEAPVLPRLPARLQATANGFGLVSQEAVFRVCDQPHPVLVSSVVKQCMDARIDDAYNGMKVGRAGLWEGL